MARRWLLIAIGIALVPATIVLASGGSRPFWVIAVLVLALVNGAVAQSRRVSETQAARLVDRALGLHEQLGTALELQAGGAPPVGLAALVLEDATAAVQASLSTARVAGRRAGTEWAWVGAAACVLAVVILVPRHGAAGAASAARTGAAGPGVARRTGSGAQPGTPPRPNAASIAAAQKSANVGTPRTGHGVGATRWAGAGISPNQRAQIRATAQGSAAGHQQKSGLSVASAGGVPNGARVSGLSGSGHSSTGTAGKADRASEPTRNGAGPTPANSGAKSAHGAAKSIHSTNGTPGGATAGTQRASASHRTGVVPVLGTGSKQLPLQVGYTPAGSGHVSNHEGQSQSSGGGGGSGGASGQAGSGSGPGGTNFSVIPTTSNAPSSSDQDLLQTFFGTTDQLTFKGW